MKKRLLSLVTTAVVAATMLFGGSAAAFAGETPVQSKATGTTAKVEASMQKGYEFIVCHETLTVDSTISDEYGFPDDAIDEATTGKVTAFDVLLAMHEAYYGDKFTKDTVGDYITAELSSYGGGYYVAKAFGIENGIGVYVDDAYIMGSGAAVANGSKCDWFMYQDTTNYTDAFSYFSKGGKSNATYEGKAAGPIAVELYGVTGFDANYMPIMGALPNAEIYVADQKTGKRQDSAIAKTDANGKASVTFTKAGTYYLTAIRDEAAGYITMPWCKVTVTKKAATAKPKKVTGVKVKGKKKAIAVSWKKVSNANGYQILCAKDAKFKKGKKTVTVKTKKTTKKTVKKLKSGKKYYVKVRAYKKVSGDKVYGAYSKVKKVKTK